MYDYHTLMLLPLDLQRRIIYYLNSADAISLTESNILFGKVNVSALHPLPMPSLHAYGGYHDGDIPQPYQPPRIKICSNIISNIHSIAVRAQWRDQSWGNQKGMLYIVATPTIQKLRNTTYDNESTQDQESTTNNNLFNGGRVVTMTAT
jgi:hypothetical protein